DYYRLSAVLGGRVEIGATQLLARAQLGAAGPGLPPHRTFVLGGRGTLPGERFRAFGGRRAALAHLEWRVDAPFPAIPLGSFASTGRSITLAPFVALGWSDRPLPGFPWEETDGVRPVLGLAVEWLMRLVRIEAGYAPGTGRIGVTVDVSREWWGIL
ncbi:MAG TPA: hypothetical protein VNK43_02185, partial [Gemmatimonadales bacterium]|nr:hypothetical protein [Gemmatimonadales bacterium]